MNKKGQIYKLKLDPYRNFIFYHLKTGTANIAALTRLLGCTEKTLAKWMKRNPLPSSFVSNEQKIIEIDKPNAIICAASKTDDGRIVKSYRHVDQRMLDYMARQKWLAHDFTTQGFIDMRGNFLTREKAAKVFVDNNQFDAGKQMVLDGHITERERYKGHEKPRGILFSETVY